MTPPTLFDHALVGLLVLVLLFAVLRGQPKLKTMSMDTTTKLWIYWSNGAVLWLGAVAVGAVGAREAALLANLGLTMNHRSVGAGAAIAAAFVAVFVLYTWSKAATADRRTRLLTKWRDEAAFLPATGRELAHFSFLAITAGVTEEIIFRGYVISYVGWFTGPSTAGVAAAIALPAIAFGEAHWYQGWTARLYIVGMAVAMGLIFVITGSLLLPIALHALVDIASGTVAWRLTVAADPDRPCTS